LGVVLGLLLSLSDGKAVETRTWTDLQGRKVDATLVRVEGQTVVLKLKDEREVPYPLAKLSEDDAKYVEETRHTPSAGTPKQAPATGGKTVGNGKPADFDSPWPQIIKATEDPGITIVAEDPEKKSFIYESANYRYVCDVRLTKAVVKAFAVMFEATHLFCSSLPLALDGGTVGEGKQQIELFKEKEDYVRAGGPPSSAGVFISKRGVVMVPLTSLGVKPFGSGFMLDRTKDSRALPHELTHQLTPHPYFKQGAMGWFSEGLAEYVANTPYQSGSYHVHNNQKDIIEYVTGTGSKGKGGRSLGTKIKLPSLSSFMQQEYPEFLEHPQLNYGCALLLTYYFFHMDGDGDGKRIKAFLKALKEGKDGEQALEYLTDGRSFEKVQTEFTKAWGRKGVDFNFDSGK